MNTDVDGNDNGWSGSFMRNTICSKFFNVLPSELKIVITACTKYTDNVGGGSNTASNVTATSDNIWILSEFETFGNRTTANSYEQNYQQQYSYYKNGNSKIKYKHNSINSMCQWYLRSAYATNASYYCGVNTGGNLDSYQVNYSLGFAPCFVIG